MKIIIIGSGIAGLTLSLACQRSGMQVSIYEKAQQLKNIGGGILLWPHGLRYLNWLGLADCLRPYHVDVTGFDMLSDKGDKIFSEKYADLYSLLGGGILPIDRSIFQQALLAKLDKNNLHLAKTCVRVSSDEKEACAYFADGTEDSADIIVGADGIYSTVRQYVNPHAAHEYANYCWFGGIIEKNNTAFFLKDRACLAMGINKIFIAWPTAQQRMMWYMPVKMSLENYAKDAELAQLNRLCADWLPEIKETVFSSSNRQRFYLPIHTMAPQDLFKQRIVLIGDAAHALGPILGQGASQAIEDAYLLFHSLLKMHDGHHQHLANYATLRLEKYQRLAVLENQTADAMVHETKETLDLFQDQVKDLSLLAMYQELIPWVNEAYCERNRGA